MSHFFCFGLVFAPWNTNGFLFDTGHYIWTFFFPFVFFRVTPTAYGSFQARGRIRATAADLRHSTAMQDLSRVYHLHHSSCQRLILTH